MKDAEVPAPRPPAEAPDDYPACADDRAWDVAFTSDKFLSLLSEARTQIANGQTKPMTLGDLLHLDQ